jgi:methylenetetrahydrofolate dehydrogenase (NADP+)/methenyltetrahydrofolate cyclohydrolase
MDGKAVAAQVTEALKARAASLAAAGTHPHLAVILVGDDPASHIYVRNKEKGCQDVGMRSTVMRLPADTDQATLEYRVRALNDDASVHGILVQLPLPAHLDEQAVLALLHPDKDVDGLHVANAGRLLAGIPGPRPCTPQGCMALLDYYGIPIAGKEAVVIGRSNLVGKPMAALLMHANATVTLCHSRTQDLAAHARRADILVVAVGKPRWITGDMVKPGAAVLDVGINRVDGKVVGDVDFESAARVAGYITPVPGGVGKMTIAMLLRNTLDAAERAAGA